MFPSNMNLGFRAPPGLKYTVLYSDANTDMDPDMPDLIRRS